MSRVDLNFEHFDRVVKPDDLPNGHLHIVVFGPGHGEAILVRTPDGRVGLIDACGAQPEASERGSPIFGLIRDLGVTRLLFACLTHPHQDHFLGFAELIDAYNPEHLWWPGSYERGFFQHYEEYVRKTRTASVETSATKAPLVKELEPVVNAIGRLADAPPRGLTPRPRAQNLSDWKVVLRHPIPERGAIEVNSILPSSSAIRLAEQDVLNALATNTLADGRKVDPNRISAALLISWGQTKILLGGDAVCHGEAAHQGWNGIQYPIGKVHVVKAPHHASAGAYSEDLWNEMKPDLAIVTCVKHATSTQPPRPDMLGKLIAHCNALALTSYPRWWKSPSHKLVAWPHEWPGETSGVKKSVTGVLAPLAKAASGENKHRNAVVVRLNEKGEILRVALHGDARRLT